MRSFSSHGRAARFCGLIALSLAMTLPRVGLAQTATSQNDTQTNARIKAIEDQIRALQEELQRVKTDLDKKDEQLRQSQEDARKAQEQTRQVQEQTRQVQEQVKKVEARKPLVTFPGGRPTITSEDGQYSFAIGAQVQFDVGGYVQNSSADSNTQPPGARHLNDGENLRRGRLYFVGKMGDFTLNFTPDFGDSPDGVITLYEANLNYTYGPLIATLGYFKPWITLQDSMSSNDFLFLERPSIVEIARNVAAGDFRASAGAKASTEKYFASFYFTGADWGSQNPNLLNDQQTGIVGRVATRPFRGKDWNTHIGASGSYVFNTNKNDANDPNETIQLRDRPELRIDMNRLIDTGQIPAVHADTYGIELAANWRNFMAQAEYIRIGVERNDPSRNLNFQGGYIEGSWVMTGESRPYIVSQAAYGRPIPEHPFSLETGDWGAWELALRYSITDLDSDVNDGEPVGDTGGIFGGLQQVYSIGLSWYPINQVRFQLQFSHVDVDRRDPSNGSTHVGQNFQSIALRSQVAF